MTADAPASFSSLVRITYTRRTVDASLLAAVPRLFSGVLGKAWPDPPKTILMCSCEDTMRLDTAAVKRGCRNSEIATFRQLCRAELDQFRNAAKAEGSLIVGCTQEAPLFSDEAGERPERIDFVNLRETAGWSTEGAQAGPKMAALLAAAAEPAPDFPFVNLSSEGVILIYGRDESAVEAGRLLADHLDVTVMISKAGADRAAGDDIVSRSSRERSATPRAISGPSSSTIDDYAAPRPSSRDALDLRSLPQRRDLALRLVLDLSGGPPLFPAHDLRDGYLRADPRDPAAMLRAVLKARDLVGSFDKPKYINFTAELCAHSRSKLTGCHRCLDLCPTGAITPDGDHVKISAEICAGCGQCAAACPTGAASYALPPADTLLHKLRAMLLTYREAGGSQPIVLFHDGQHGTRADRCARPPWRRPAGQCAAACRQRGDAGRAGSDRRRHSPMARRACVSFCAQNRCTTSPAFPRPSRWPMPFFPGSDFRGAVLRRSKRTIRMCSARRCAAIEPAPAVEQPATFRTVGKRRDLLRFALQRTAPRRARADRRDCAARGRAARRDQRQCGRMHACACPAYRSVPPARFSTIPNVRRSNLSKMPACSAGCARAPARKRSSR